jgi:hypothetical protein
MPNQQQPIHQVIIFEEKTTALSDNMKKITSSSIEISNKLKLFFSNKLKLYTKITFANAHFQKWWPYDSSISVQGTCRFFSNQDLPSKMIY